MGKVKTNIHKALLFVGILYNNDDDLKKAVNELKNEFGSTIHFKADIDFDVTDYYNDEMGENLQKAFLVFEQLIDMSEISDIKLKTNEIEKEFTDKGGHRNVNLDPGYLTLSKIVLPTTKNRGHRIYLKKGIFAEVTLYYYNNSYRSYEWTYPDFKKEEYINFFNKIRKNYKEKIS